MQRLSSTGHTDIIAAFLAELAACDIRPSDPSRIKLDGAWHRLHVEGDRRGDENLAYRIFNDSHPAGVFTDHKRGVTGKFSSFRETSVTDVDRAAWAAASAARQAAQEADYEAAAVSAHKVLCAASHPPASHPYAVRKGITAPEVSVKATASLLLIPVYRAFGQKPASLQSIDADGGKLFHPGGRMAGCFHPISNQADKRRILVCEGYATGYAISQASGHSVACAMSAGNIPAVAALMRAKFADREVVVCADNDHGTEARTGKNPGIEAAKASGCRWIAPTFAADDSGTDWDDAIRARGPGELLESLNATATPAAELELEPEPTRRTPEPMLEAEPVNAELEPFRNAEPEPPAYSARVSWDDLNLVRGGGGIPIAHLDNAVRIIDGHDETVGRIWFDDFLGRVLTTWGDTGEHEWSDADDIRMTLWIQRRMRIPKLAVGTVRDAVTVVAQANRKNECADWLNSLQWDGFDRIENVLSRGFGAEYSEYTRSVGRCWLISLVARALTPGCKVDTMPIFEGAQGRGKSSALQALAGPRWFAEAAESVMSKDFFGGLQGKWLVEIAEMDTFSRAETNAVKRVVSCQTDRYRAPYARRTEDHPRTCGFAGTTNESEYLRDQTGARRFWPVACGSIDLDWIIANRAQLFAEAVMRFREGAPWWDIPATDAAAEQEQRRVSDEWEPIIAGWLIGHNETQVGEVLEGALKISPESWDKLTQMRVAGILKAMGWHRVLARRGGKPCRVWMREGTQGGDELL